jgi:2'-5' RNA ligase
LLRSFLAVELPELILNRIGEIQRDLKSSRADVRWVSPENIHLTLKFFGNIEESLIQHIVQSIEGPLQDTSPFFLKVQGMGAFPNLKNPRVIWMGFQEGKEIIVSIQKQLEREFEKIGFQPEDRPFHPHLTLGRMRSNRGKDDLVKGMERYREGEFGSFQVEKVILFKSDLRPMGPIYTPLREIRLGR